MVKEKAYDFQKKMRQIHEKDIRDYSKKVPEGFFELTDGMQIQIDPMASLVIKTAALDFVDFLEVSMGIEVTLGRRNFVQADGAIRIFLAEDAGVDLGEGARYKGFLIRTGDCIEIFANDDRGAAAALYYLEDVMSMEQAPFVECGEIKHWAMFSPQMIHSGYGLDEYPNEYLSAIAHQGRDAILVYTMDINVIPHGYLDFNELIDRAARYGIDVYAYSYFKSEMSPEAPGAEAYYENTYGKLFKECPGLKGVILVGEIVEFPSRDPHVGKGKYFEGIQQGILRGKPSSGFYPCEDYPIWLNLIKKVIQKYNKDADIVFWSYNWGSQPEDARVALIKNLPTDISLQATFEMFEPRRIGDAVTHCADYTLSFEGPGVYFKSEAEAAKERGLRLYSMTNTGGLTWDFGAIPYQPMPFQWLRRYEAMRKAQKDWGLCGIMESHHFGFYPSFISKLSKWAFYEPQVDIETVLNKIIRSEFGEGNYEFVSEALEVWSEAIRCYTPSDSDQYGPFRCGPSFPFYQYKLSALPSSPEVSKHSFGCDLFGSRICVANNLLGPDVRSSIPSIRVPQELKSLEKMYDLMEVGIKQLEAAPDQNEKLFKLYNLGCFMLRTIRTGINHKKWYLLKNQFFAETCKDELRRMLDEMEQLLKEEMENAILTIPLVEADSRLGWEPRMLYVTDREHLEWKVRQVQAVLDYEIARYRECLKW